MKYVSQHLKNCADSPVENVFIINMGRTRIIPTLGTVGKPKTLIAFLFKGRYERILVVYFLSINPNFIEWRNMKFILWTIVWFGLTELSRVCEFGFKYHETLMVAHTDDIRFISNVLGIFLWIFLYIKFVRD